MTYKQLLSFWLFPLLLPMVVLSACTTTRSYVSPIPPSTPAIFSTPQPRFLPHVLVIPKLKVEAPIQPVGLDHEQRMDVPTGDAEVGWYQHGPVPGEEGSAVIDGHLDSPTGPAIFYHLDRLHPGDSVFVGLNNGKELHFRVEEIKQFSDVSFPIDVVFKQHDGKRLNLITCSGTFDRKVKNYSNRLVVFTKLQEE